MNCCCTLFFFQMYVKMFTWPINSLVYGVLAVGLLLWWHFDQPGKLAVVIAIQWCMPDKMHAHTRLPVMVLLIHPHKLGKRALHQHHLEIVLTHNPFSLNCFGNWFHTRRCSITTIKIWMIGIFLFHNILYSLFLLLCLPPQNLVYNLQKCCYASMPCDSCVVL